MGFYLTVYVPDANAQQTATVDLIQNGAVLARLPLELEHPDAERRIRQVGRLPIDQLAAGSYELRVVVHQGNDDRQPNISISHRRVEISRSLQ